MPGHPPQALPDECELGEGLDPEVVAWRAEQLRKAGYPDAVSEMMAELMDIDLHVARRLRMAGCSAAIAARILI